MRINNPENSTPLTLELQKTLEMFRLKRGFSPDLYIEAKSMLFNSYMNHFGLNACVVGVSGGIDSAVTLGFIKEASKFKDSPIKRIVAAFLPIFNTDGGTNQDVALARGKEVAAAFDVEGVTIDLSSSFKSLKASADSGSKIKGKSWASGQLVSYLRTPALYYLTSLLTQENFSPILCGTTNRDEGAYLGFFGKASDGMVDVQLISDLHKSEVYALGELLGVPDNIQKAVPNGDMFDNRTDEDVFGTSYDFVELYMYYLSANTKDQEKIQKSFNNQSDKQFMELSKSLEALHSYNSHKYLGNSPAVHLDVYERAVPSKATIQNRKADAVSQKTNNSFVGEFSLSLGFIEKLEQSANSPLLKKSLLDFEESGFQLSNIFEKEDCALLKKELLQQKWIPVGQNGMKKEFDILQDKVGSYRATTYSESFADLLWNRIASSIPSIRIMKDDTPTDWNGDRVWRAIGINPLFRFICYEQNGLLIPHYDATYEFNENKRTLMSFIIYLTNSEESAGGATRFLIDPQSKIPLIERQYEDWLVPASDENILGSILPQAGSGLIFDHRILHDSEVLKNSKMKLLLRTDIVFERCGLKL